MPPSQHVIQYIPCSNSNKSQEEKELISHQQQKNESFTKHCRIFYQHSLSINDNGNKDINTSREIMNVFNSLVSSHQQQQPITIKKTEIGYSELIKCGLNGINSQHIIELTKIRDTERRKAHKQGMKQRCKAFHMVLEQAHVLNEDNKRDYTKYIKDFVSSHKQNIGVHPILAGIRKLLETQVKNDQNVIHWKFHSTSITESFDNNVNDSTAYFLKVAVMFQSFLMRIEEEEREEADDGGYVLCWKVKESLNRRKMRKLLSCIPHARDLHAKPTGKLCATEMIRSSDKEFWCFC